LLKVVSALMGMGLSFVFRCCNICQNYLGLYFRMFGSS
jgi:hypothetical protein